MNLLTQYLQAGADAIDFPAVDRWIENHSEIPAIVTVLYLLFVHVVGNTLMKSRPAYRLRFINIVWNLFLSSFSFLGVIYCVPRLYEVVTAPAISGLNPSSLRYLFNMTPALRRNILLPDEFREGVDVAKLRGSLDTSLCVFLSDLHRRNIPGLFCLAFMLSKIPEMFDTVLLILQKKPVIFLHWYHHITVMLYCWHAWLSPTGSGLWFVCMNYGVHSIMYLYYFISSCGYGKLLRPFAPLITFLQIAQMIIGSLIAIYVLYMNQFGGGCDCRLSNAVLAIVMYVSYFLLFANFFRRRYLQKKSKQERTVTPSVKDSYSLKKCN